MSRVTKSYGLNNPLQDVFPSPVVASRVPTTSDKGHQIGRLWVNKAANSVYVLTSIASGSATWTIVS